MNNALNLAVERAAREIVTSALSWRVSNGRFVTRPVNCSTSETSSIIGFVGGIEGTLTLRCTRKIAVEATRAMLGIDATEDSAEVRDAVGELLNMVIGQAKTYYAEQNESFNFTLPTTVMGDNYQIYVRARPGATVSAIHFLCPMGPFCVEVFVKS
jgi:chemotaxis protein CheX